MKNYNLILNDKLEIISDYDPSTLLLDWIRDKKKLTGTKEGCAEGDCGACSVLLSPIEGGKSKAINSCLVKLGQVVGASVTTVEGLGSANNPNIIQSMISENSGSQCGFCTPGIVVSLSGLLNKERKVDIDDIHDSLSGNLCRCTGYNPIIKSIEKINYRKFKIIKSNKWLNYKNYQGINSSYFYPRSIEEAKIILSKINKIKIIAGGTDLNLSKSIENKFMILNRINSLRQIKINKKNLIIGASSSLEDLLPHINDKIPYLAKIVKRFGSVQIRSQATIAGNISTASPIGDMAPSLLVLDSKIDLISNKYDKIIPIDTFFKGYRKTILKKNEFIKNIIIPLPENNSTFYAWKLSKRYDQDISTISIAAKLIFNNKKLISCKIAFGGMASIPIRSKIIENYFLKNFLEIDFNKIDYLLKEEFQPLSDLRGSSSYRILASNGLIKRLVFALNKPNKLLEVFN